MNVRVLVACLIVAAGLGAVWVYSNPSKGSATDLGKAPPTPAGEPSKPATVETPPPGSPTDAERAVATEEQPTMPDLKVEPLLELNGAFGDGMVVADAETAEAKIGELLLGKYDGQTRSQLKRYFALLDDTLRAQQNPDATTKVLPAASVTAMQIERNWLKEFLSH